MDQRAGVEGSQLHDPEPAGDGDDAHPDLTTLRLTSEEIQAAWDCARVAWTGGQVRSSAVGVVLVNLQGKLEAAGAVPQEKGP